MVQLTKENLIYIGASGTIAVAALALIGSSIFSGATTESLEITSASLKKASGDAVLNVQVRNSGTSEITGVTVTINGVKLDSTKITAVDNTFLIASNTTCGNTGNSCNVEFKNEEDINAGQTVSYSGSIPGSNGLTVGTSYVVTVTGNIENSGAITNTAVVAVTRF